MGFNIPDGGNQLASAPQAPQADYGPRSALGIFGHSVAGFEDTMGDIVHGQQVEQQRQKLQADHEAALARAAADQATAKTATINGHDQLQDLADAHKQGVIDGTIPKDKAEQQFKEQSQKLIEDSVNGVPQAYQSQATESLLAAQNRFGNQVRQTVTKRDRMDVTGGISSTLTYELHNYPADPEGATKRASDTIDQLGPFSDRTPEQLVMMKQGWKQASQYTAGFNAVENGRYDPKALNSAEKMVRDGLPDIDEQKRASLLDRVQIMRHAQDEHALQMQQRAMLAEQRRLNIAGTAYDAATKAAQEGTLNTDYAEQQQKLMAGTPYQDAFRQVLEMQKTNGPLAAQSPKTLQGALDYTNAQMATTGVTQDLLAQRERLTKVQASQQADISNLGPVGAAVKRGLVLPWPDLDFSQGPVGVAQQLKARGDGAAKASAWAGVMASRVKPGEALQIADQLKSMAPTDRAGYTAVLAQSMTPAEMQAFANDVDKHDHGLYLGLKLGGSMTTESRPASTMLYLGQQALKDKGIKVDDTAVTGDRGQISALIGNALQGKERDDAIDAATMIFQGFKADGQSQDYGRAVRLALGGPVIDRGDAGKLPIPMWMNVDQFRSRLGSVRPQDVTPQPGALPTQGLAAPGNIDTSKRVVGSSTSLSFGGHEYLLPATSESGKPMSDSEVAAEFKKTGQHLGAFDTPDNAKAYAQSLHEHQAAGLVFSSDGSKVQSMADFLKALPQATLEPSGPLPAARGRYTVRFGAGIAKLADGKPLIIDLNTSATPDPEPVLPSARPGR